MRPLRLGTLGGRRHLSTASTVLLQRRVYLVGTPDGLEIVTGKNALHHEVQRALGHVAGKIEHVDQIHTTPELCILEWQFVGPAQVLDEDVPVANVLLEQPFRRTEQPLERMPVQMRARRCQAAPVGERLDPRNAALHYGQRA